MCSYRDQQTKTFEYINVKKKNMRFENDSDFSQDSQKERPQHHQLIAEEEIRTSLVREDELRKEIETGINSFQSKSHNILRSIDALIKDNVQQVQQTSQQSQHLPTNSQENMFQSLQMPTYSSVLPISTMSQSQSTLGGFDSLSEFLRQTQSNKQALSKNKLNFHNSLYFDKSITKNQGGAGSQNSNYYSLKRNLKDPKDIISEKNKQYSLELPEQLKVYASQASQMLTADKQFTRTIVEGGFNRNGGSRSLRVDDVSHRIDANIDIQDQKLRQYQKLKRVIESSVDQMNLDNTTKSQLLGLTQVNLPSDLSVIDEMINDRKMVVNELEEHNKLLNDHINQQEKVRFMVKRNKNENNSLSIRPQSKLEAQIFKKHQNIIKTETRFDTSSSNRNNPSEFMGKRNIKTSSEMGSMPLLSRQSNSRSVAQLPTFNIKINNNNFYMSPPSQNIKSPGLQSPFSDAKQDSTQYGSFTQASNQAQTKPKFEIPENRNKLQSPLGNPSSRKDAETLKDWFQMMVKKVEDETEINNEKKHSLKMNVYHATFLEVARQVSVQCLDRGQLLNELWNGFFTDMQVKKLKDDKDKMEKKLKDELDDLNIFYLDQLKRKNSEIDKMAQFIQDQKQSLLQKNRECEDHKIEAERWKLKFENLMKKYKQSKFKLMLHNEAEKDTYSPPILKNDLSFFPGLEMIKSGDSNGRNIELKSALKHNTQTEEDRAQNNDESSLASNDKKGADYKRRDQRHLSLMNNRRELKTSIDLQVYSMKARDNNNNKDSRRSQQPLAQQPVQPEEKKDSKPAQADKNIDTNDFTSKHFLDEETQTMGISALISSLAEQQLDKSKKQKSRVKIDFGEGGISFEDDIQNIIAEETEHQELIEKQMHQRLQSELNKIQMIKKRSQDESQVHIQIPASSSGSVTHQNSQVTGGIMQLQQKDVIQDSTVSIFDLKNKSQRNNNDNLSNNQTPNNANNSHGNDQQRRTSLFNPNQSSHNNNQNSGGDSTQNNNKNILNTFSVGLKQGLMQRIISKLKDSFKQKEGLLKQLIEENRDLFSQLDIEKAKFQQVLKMQGDDAKQLVDLQSKLDTAHKQLQKERTRHNYYKDLIQEISGMSEVKKKIDLSVSDVENDDQFKSNDGKSLKSGDVVSGRNHSNKRGDIKHQESMTSSDFQSKNLFMDFGIEDDEDLLLDDENMDYDDNDQDNSNALARKKDSIKSKEGRQMQNDLQRHSMKKKMKNLQIHPGQIFVTKLIKKVNMPTFIRYSSTLKQLLKTINNAYNSLINIYKNDLSDFKNAFALKQGCVEFVYDGFMRSCGIKNMAEKKFASTMSACVKYKSKIERVKLFGRFLGLYDPLDKESFKFYMMALNYLINVSTFGYIVPANDYDEIHYVPYIRVNDFMRTFFENRISIEEYQELKQKIEKLKENDFKKNRNTFIVEQDRAIEILMDQHIEMLNQKRGHVQDLFKAFDFQSMDVIDIQAFFLLISHIEEKDKSFTRIKNLFERNCELIAIYSVKDVKKFLTSENFIALCFQEKLFSRDQQMNFLKINDQNDYDAFYEQVTKFKENLQDEMEQIKKRFYNIQPYFKDLMQLIYAMLQSYKEAKLRKKCKQLWILIRILQEESKRQYIEYFSQTFMGDLNNFIMVNMTKQAQEEEKQLFDQKFTRSKNDNNNNYNEKKKTIDISYNTIQQLKIPQAAVVEQPQPRVKSGGKRQSMR